MKKSLIVLSIASIIGASVAHSAPEVNTFYLGAKAGYSQISNISDVKKMLPVDENIHYQYKKNSFAYGLFAGYQITPYIAVELGLDEFGTFKINSKAPGVGTGGGEELEVITQVSEEIIPQGSQGSTKQAGRIKQTSRGVQLTVKGSIPVMDALDIYARAGVAYTRNKYKATNFFTGDEYRFVSGSDKHSRTGFIGAVGTEYALTKDVAMRLEYQYLHQADKLRELTLDGEKVSLSRTHKPSIHSVFLGVSYRFGQTGAAAPVAAAKKFAVSSEVLFDFNKASLKASGKQEIANLHNQIIELKLANPQVEVQGYADRIGNAQYNQKLSQKRADTVAKALVTEGFSQDSISAIGYGSQNPVTGNSCDAVQGHTALIECLAPDRRVEILVEKAK